MIKVNLTLYVTLVFTRITRSDFLNIVFSNFLGLFKFGEDGEFRANEAAKTTFHAIFGVKDNLGRMIPLHVESLALLQTAVWTEFNTEPTAFAATFNNIDNALWN